MNISKSLIELVFPAFIFLVLFGCDKSDIPDQRNRQSLKTEIFRRTPQNKEIDADRLLRLVNDVRVSGCICKNAKEGVSTIMPSVHLVTWSDKLANLAKLHAKDMSLNESLSPLNSDGIIPGNRIEKIGYKPIVLTESMAKSHSNEEAVFNFWLNNYEDCKKIMDPRVREMGAGRAGSDVFYWSQLFGSERIYLISKQILLPKRKEVAEN